MDLEINLRLYLVVWQSNDLGFHVVHIITFI